MGERTVAVIGAGPAGLTAAYQLALKGVKVRVFEAEAAVGGMAKTVPMFGQKVDLGPHRFFSSDPRVNRVWLDAIGSDYSMVSRQTRIYYRNRFFDYPLKAGNALLGLGPTEAALCLLSYLKAKALPEAPEPTFESWVCKRFGRRLFSIFFKAYNEKLWGIAPSRLDADFASQRIKKLSLFEAARAALLGSGGARHKTLVDEFAYPKEGAGAVYEAMAQKLRGLGGEISLATPVASVHPAPQGPTLRLEDGTELGFDHVISTMPLSTLVERMGAPEPVLQHARALRYRNTILAYLQVAGASPFPDQWIYVHAPELGTGRITNFGNWGPGIKNGQADTILCLEYWCYDSDPIWGQDEASLVALATQEAAKTGLVSAASVKAGKVLRVPKCYPVYEAGYRSHLRPVEEFLARQPGLSVIGRYGAFKYNNQDHSILMGLLAAENIAEGAKHDLWAINTDYEYQESSTITATGLSQPLAP